ncbi:MAG: hypothetical protein J3R72DRAFT_421066 [Linnemannia gamsii]|nr:MAG: hypothetical protein J3R72DRAFT_421066 [Linnemannia gamsii]
MKVSLSFLISTILLTYSALSTVTVRASPSDSVKDTAAGTLAQVIPSTKAVAPQGLRYNSLFRRQAAACKEDFYLCAGSQEQCCAVGTSCCPTGNCCPAGHTCVSNSGVPRGCCPGESKCHGE